MAVFVMSPMVTSCPKSIRSYADGFSDLLFDVTDYRAFVATLCAAIFGISGYCNIFRFLMFSPSVSSLCNFFKTPELFSSLNRRHRKILLRLYPKMLEDPSRFLWVIDDTLIEKTGEKVWGAYHWWDHKKKCSVLAHKLLVLGIVDCKRHILIPVAWEILHRDLNESIETEQQKKDNHEKGWEVALKLLDECLSFGFPKCAVAADSWFACEKFFNALIARNIFFVMEIRNTRIISQHHFKKIDQNAKEFFSDRVRHNIYFGSKRKWASEATVLLKDAKNPLKVVAIANNKSLDDNAFSYYVTNKLTWNASKVWSLSRQRWAIEVQFRDLKQIFTLGEAAVRLQNAIEMSISIAMFALTVIRLEQMNRVGANENQYIRPKPAGDIVRELMLENLQQGMGKLAQENFGKLLRESIAKRITLKNLNGKPAEKRKVAQTLKLPEKNAALT
jgi:DDE superfamily endonuclease